MLSFFEEINMFTQKTDRNFYYHLVFLFHKAVVGHKDERTTFE